MQKKAKKESWLDGGYEKNGLKQHTHAISVLPDMIRHALETGCSSWNLKDSFYPFLFQVSYT